MSGTSYADDLLIEPRRLGRLLEISQTGSYINAKSCPTAFQKRAAHISMMLELSRAWEQTQSGRIPRTHILRPCHWVLSSFIEVAMNRPNTPATNRETGHEPKSPKQTWEWSYELEHLVLLHCMHRAIQYEDLNALIRCFKQQYDSKSPFPAK